MKLSRSKEQGETRTGELLLLITAMIWGVAFVAQRAGMEHIGPFLFNGIRFALGVLSLVPLMVLRKEKKRTVPSAASLKGGIVTGLILFVAASLQQTGIVFTTAANAGFITSLYVIIVPVFGVFLGYRIRNMVWMGASLAIPGLYLLSVTGHFSVSQGDLLVLGSAFFWAVHVMMLARYAPVSDPIAFSAIQFSVCSLLSLLVAFSTETIQAEAIGRAAIPVLYGGIMSVGIAYTLQVTAQRKAHPASAALILSLEALFAAAGGWILLHEVMSFREVAGGALLLAGVMISQMKYKREPLCPVVDSKFPIN